MINFVVCYHSFHVLRVVELRTIGAAGEISRMRTRNYEMAYCRKVFSDDFLHFLKKSFEYLMSVECL